jgi:hypothetical protein
MQTFILWVRMSMPLLASHMLRVKITTTWTLSLVRQRHK